MFSPALEVILNIAFREAISRGHAYLTLEHLLYAMAHDPDGERILGACGADLPQLRRDLDKYLQETLEQFSRGQQKEPEQTLAFRRVLQTAVLHVQSAGRQEVQSGDVLAAILQQNKSYAAQLMAAQGVTRLDILQYITHGIAKVPRIDSTGSDETAPDAEAGGGERGSATSRDPLAAYATNLTARARAGEKVRIWSAGCSSGEEVYSIAMTLAGESGSSAAWLKQGDVRLLATDIAPHVVQAVSEARYAASTVAPIPAAYRRQWLRQDGADSHVVSDALRSLVTARVLNLFQPWPMRQAYDAIFCRNVMIYFDNATKAALIDRFIQTIKPGGFLYIGHSESFHGSHPELQLAGRTTYRRKA